MITASTKKLEGGIFNGQIFSQIPTLTKSGFGSFSIQTKEKLTTEKIISSFESSINFEKNLSNIFEAIGKLSGGISLRELQSIKDAKEAWKNLKKGKLNPGTVLLITTASCFLLESEKHADNAEKLVEILKNYGDLHSAVYTADPTEAKGVYVVSYASGSVGTGGAGFYHQTSYYDVATKKFLGTISGAN